MVFSIITLYAQSSGKSASIKDYPFSLSSRLANTPVSFVSYLEKTFWPHDLAVFYPFSDQLPIWQVLGASLLILIVSASVIVLVKRLPYLFVGWLWYAVTLLPVIRIIQIGKHAMADRYHYLPSIGISVMLAWGVPSLIKNEDVRKKILFPAGIAALFILSVLTWQQCGYWKNSIELFNHTLQVTRDNAVAHYNRGVAYYDVGQYQLAIEDFNEAVRLKPDYADAYYGRRAAYLSDGNNYFGCRDAQKACALGLCKLLEVAKDRRDCR